jgi:hypothetical protein
MEIKDIKTLKEVSEESGINVKTLMLRFNTAAGKEIIENVDYKKLGHRQPILLTPNAIKILTDKKSRGKNND